MIEMLALPQIYLARLKAEEQKAKQKDAKK
ncbi:hypothetical protein DFP78_10763 [Photobacterium lutimaris]|nr:hypothetical protein DFP78_10763 [Photobacterium lutimaris]